MVANLELGLGVLPELRLISGLLEEMTALEGGLSGITPLFWVSSACAHAHTHPPPASSLNVPSWDST